MVIKNKKGTELNVPSILKYLVAVQSYLFLRMEFTLNKELEELREAERSLLNKLYSEVYYKADCIVMNLPKNQKKKLLKYGKAYLNTKSHNLVVVLDKHKYDITYGVISISKYKGRIEKLEETDFPLIKGIEYNALALMSNRKINPTLPLALYVIYGDYSIYDQILEKEDDSKVYLTIQGNALCVEEYKILLWKESNIYQTIINGG